MTADIEVQLEDVSPEDLAEAIGRQIAGDPTWNRDGILEHQVSTQEDHQLCFRNEPDGERPRTALCLAGTAETLTVATVVPIDRGVELDDEQYDAVVVEFFTNVLTGATDGTQVAVALDKET
jgi:hypothetical protein